MNGIAALKASEERLGKAPGVAGPARRDVAAIFDDEGGHRFLGMPVRPIGDNVDVPYDLIVVATLEISGERMANLMRDGVPPEKLFPLRRSAIPPPTVRSIAAGERR